MIALPSHAVNADIVVGEVTLPAVPGVDLAATVERIGDWGGDPGLYSLFLGAGLAASSQRDAATARSLGVIAGWRAGVLDLRGDALTHAVDGEPAAVAATLGLDPQLLPAFLAAQATDRFAWPLGGRLIASLGGFRGFGGSWVAAPMRFFSTGDGTFGVITGTESWAVHADVFGSRVTRVDGLNLERPDARLELRLNPYSYLVQLLRAGTA